MQKTILLLSFILLVSCHTREAYHYDFSKSLVGIYHLNYVAPLNKTYNGWDINQLDREEFLELKSDSSFILTRISPQGGFEILPDTGIWLVNKERLMIQHKWIKQPRAFASDTNGVYEIKCKEKRLSGVLWKRENK